MGLSEISRALNIKKATAFRLLTTLEQFLFVERADQERKYCIGKNAFYVGSGFFAGEREGAIRQTMKRLARECKHTVTMSVLDGNSVLFIDRVNGESKVRVSVEVGSRVPAYASASGKVLLAALSDTEVKARFKGKQFQRRTSRTVRSLKDLLADLATVRKRSIAFSNEESTEGLCALSVPVRSDKGDHVAALTVAYPAGTLTDREQGTLAEKVKAAARHIILERV
jgi:DNA-binding IclR family transcriptional regulator